MFLTAGRERGRDKTRSTFSKLFNGLCATLCYYRRFRGPSTYHHTTLATSMPSARRVSLGALIAGSLFLVALTVARPECYNDDNKRCTVVEEIDRLFGFAFLMLILIVGATWPLIVLIAVVTALCCHCRHRKNRINYNAIAMIPAEERKERAKQYMAQFDPSQARPVGEAAPVAKMV